MSVAKQLYQLQEIDLEIESNELAVEQITSQLGESQAVVRTRDKLALEQQRLEELKRQQHATEWEVDDLTVKLTTAEEKLYSGRITSPKELTNLQHEIEGLKANRSQLEDKALEIMDQAEQATASVASTSSELKTLEAEWRSQQQQLSNEMEQLKSIVSDLKHKRQSLAATAYPLLYLSYGGALLSFEFLVDLDHLRVNLGYQQLPLVFKVGQCGLALLHVRR